MRQQHNKLDMLEEAWSAAIRVLFFVAGWIAANMGGGGVGSTLCVCHADSVFTATPCC